VTSRKAASPEARQCGIPFADRPVEVTILRSLFSRTALAIMLVGFAGQQANATPISFGFSGTGSGIIGGKPFTNALVVYTGTADTDDVLTLSPIVGFTAYAVGLDTLTVNIAGIGTATITDPSKILGIPQAIIDPDGDIPALPGLLLLRGDNPSDLDSGTGMAAIFGNALAGYDLKTSIGPITDVGGVGFPVNCAPGSDPCIGTSRGLLSFTTNILLDSSATFAATRQPVAVPEPASLLLMGSGLAAALIRRSRRGWRG